MTVKNTGKVDTPFIVRVYLASPNGQVSWNEDRTKPLSPNEEDTLEFKFRIPSDCPAGIWKVSVELADDNEGTIEWKNKEFKVIPPLADAEIVEFDVEEGTKYVGDEVKAKAVILNRGSTHTFRIIYTITDSRERHYTVYDSEIKIEGGEELSKEFRWTIPPDIAEGKCKGTLTIAEPYVSKYYDTKVDYNAFVVKKLGKPDLTFKHIKLSKTSGKIGEKVYAHLTLWNRGCVSVDKVVKVELYYMDKDRKVILGSREFEERIAPGESFGFAVQFNVPATTLGTHEIYARVDPDNVVDEEDENNNEVSTSLLVEFPNLEFEIIQFGGITHLTLGERNKVTVKVVSHEDYDVPPLKLTLEFRLEDWKGKGYRTLDSVPAYLNGYKCIDTIKRDVTTPALSPVVKTTRVKESLYLSEDITPTLVHADTLKLEVFYSGVKVGEDSIDIKIHPGASDAASILETMVINGIEKITGIPFFSYIYSLEKAKYKIVAKEYDKLIRNAVKYKKTGDTRHLYECAKAHASILMTTLCPNPKVAKEFLKDQLDSLKSIGNEVIYFLGYVDAWNKGEIQRDIAKKIIAFVECPVNLHVYDGSGNHTGIGKNGKIEEDVPYSLFAKLDNDSQIIVVLGSVSKIEVEGVSQGKFRLTIYEFLKEPERKVKVEYGTIAVRANTIATVDGLAKNDYTIKVDDNRDGVIDHVYSPAINIAPRAEFTTSISASTVVFDASDSYDPDGRIIKYEWNFGDGTSAEGKVVTHVYSLPGSYAVTLTITDNDGLSDTTTKVIAVGSAQAELVIKAGNIKVKKGETSKLAVYVDTEKAVGAVQLNLNFDPSVVEAKSVSAASGSLLASKIDNRAGVVKFGVASSEGIRGKVVEIEFYGKAEGFSPVQISVVDIVDTSNNPLNFKVVNGSVEVYKRIKGDANDDGRITAGDALLYLRYAVGQDISPYHLDSSDDVTGDGRITASDALKVLKVAVGGGIL